MAARTIEKALDSMRAIIAGGYRVEYGWRDPDGVERKESVVFGGLSAADARREGQRARREGSAAEAAAWREAERLLRRKAAEFRTIAEAGSAALEAFGRGDLRLAAACAAEAAAAERSFGGKVWARVHEGLERECALEPRKAMRRAAPDRS